MSSTSPLLRKMAVGRMSLVSPPIRKTALQPRLRKERSPVSGSFHVLSLLCQVNRQKDQAKYLSRKGNPKKSLSSREALRCISQCGEWVKSAISKETNGLRGCLYTYKVMVPNRLRSGSVLANRACARSGSIAIGNETV
jgi:hypothetical protein